MATQQGITLTSNATARTAETVRRVLGEPTDLSGDRSRRRSYDNSIFWARSPGEGSHPGWFEEVVPQMVYDGSGNPTGEVDWNTVTNGRLFQIGLGSAGIVAAADGYASIILVRQDFDCSVNPPKPIYMAVDQECEVYVGAWDSDNNCYAGTMNNALGLAPVGTSSGPTPIQLFSLQNNGVPMNGLFIKAVAQAMTSTGGDPLQQVVTNYIAINPVVECTLSQDGGADASEFDSSASYTYTATDTFGNALGTSLSPRKGRSPGSMSVATAGIGYWDMSLFRTFILWDTNEVGTLTTLSVVTAVDFSAMTTTTATILTGGFSTP